jgi:Leucine-rich repeat (LRR) protein
MPQSESVLLKKFQELLEISQEVKIITVANYLEINEKDLITFLVKWKNLGFKIKNDLIIVENLMEFTAALDQQFLDWYETESSKEGKVEVFNTNSELSSLKHQKKDISIIRQIESELALKIPIHTKMEDYKPGVLGAYLKDNNIICLSLSRNRINSLPDSIQNLIRLEKLSLMDCKLPKIPNWIGKLIKLTRLSLNGNNLTNIDPSIGNLIHLKTLYLEYNELNSIPRSIGKCISLDGLGLHNNHLKTLPQEILDLKRLSWINIKDNPDLLEDKQTFSTILDLEKKKISVRRYPSKNEVRLLFNSLPLAEKNSCLELNQILGKDIPVRDSVNTGIYGISYGTGYVKQLSLGSEKINKVFDAIRNFRNLEVLSLMSCNINQIPKWLGDFKKLNELSLKSNRIVNLPPYLGNLSSLKSLDLSFNDISDLPTDIVRLQNLENLDLHGTMLKKIPEILLNLQNLRVLVIDKRLDEEMSAKIIEKLNQKRITIRYYNGKR